MKTFALTALMMLSLKVFAAADSNVWFDARYASFEGTVEIDFGNGSKIVRTFRPATRDEADQVYSITKRKKMMIPLLKDDNKFDDLATKIFVSEDLSSWIMVGKDSHMTEWSETRYLVIRDNVFKQLARGEPFAAYRIQSLNNSKIVLLDINNQPFEVRIKGTQGFLGEPLPRMLSCSGAFAGK